MKPQPIERQLNLTPLECEVITLKAILSMINGMINWEIMTFHFQDTDSAVSFKTSSHKTLFNILIVDFLSIPSDFFNGEKTYLERLSDICESPNLSDKNINGLRLSVQKFKEWLSEIVIVENRWFSTIELKVDLKIKRSDFITICGDICKHNFTRLTWKANKILKIMGENGIIISRDKALYALEDFHEQFHQDVFTYHSSTIAEFLNNIRWGIYVYANAERNRSMKESRDKKMHFPKYQYIYPPQVISDLGKKYYWDLMNDVKCEPFIQPFEVTKHLKTKF